MGELIGMSANLIATITFVAVSGLSGGLGSGASTINSGAYSVQVPNSWVRLNGSSLSSFDDQSANCSYFLDKKVKHQSAALSICVIRMSPERALGQVGFQKVDDRLVRAGSMDAKPAQIEEHAGYVKVSGNASCGIYDDAGFHAAGGNCYSAIIFGRDYHIALETDGSEPLNLIHQIADSVKSKTEGDAPIFRDKLKHIDPIR
jgi:hypothetical protein